MLEGGGVILDREVHVGGGGKVYVGGGEVHVGG